MLLPALTERPVGVPVHLKLEHRQTTGSFKLRGASQRGRFAGTADEGKRGVVAASTGNHGRALAHAAKLEGMRAVICMSRLVPTNKVDEIRRLGAEVRIVGNSQDDAQEEVERLVAAEGMVMVPPFDHPAVIAGQGTLGTGDASSRCRTLRLVLVPLSGGGLAAGIAAAVKGIKPGARVIGVSMARGAAMKASLDAGRPVLVEELPTLADSLGGGIGLDNRADLCHVPRPARRCRSCVSEDEIAAGIRHAYAQEREIVEGAGAVGIAALLAGKVRASGPVVVLAVRPQHRHGPAPPDRLRRGDFDRGKRGAA